MSTRVYRTNNATNNNEFKIKINEMDIESSPRKKLLRVISNDQINFKSHMSNLCKMVYQKLNALACISSFMDLPR